MKFAEKCPKCGGFVQTKTIRKSIGLGFVEIPVAQFCLNPVCEWYQDFAEVKKPDDIKEGFQFSKNQMMALSVIMGLVVIYAIFTYFVPVFGSGGDVNPIPQTGLSEIQKNTTTSDTPKVPAPTTVPTIVPTSIPVIPPAITEPESYSIKVDVSHGFYPDPITINKSDTIIWNNEEIQRTRIMLVSKDNLFKNQLLQYPGRYQYQFNQEGRYTFILADYEPYREYKNATGTVIVR